MKAILIDPVAHTVTEVEYNGTLADLYTHLKCDMIEAAVHDIPRHILYVDEEGTFKPNSMFEIDGADQPYLGRGVILGFDPNSGADLGATVSADDVRAKVRFSFLPVH